MKGLLKVFSAAMVLGALVAGCGSGGGGGSTSGVIIDTIPPSVVYTTPVHNETGVGTDAKITVTFSENVEPTTVKKGSTFKLIKTSTNETVTLNDADVAYDETSKVATITPPSLLEGGQQYTVTVNPVVKDKADNVMTTAYTWTFTTGAAVDGTPPVLNSKAPADNATGVGTNTAIAMSFSEPMDISTFGSAFSLTSPSTTISGTFTLIGQVVIFTPATTLARNTSYTATLGTAATDLAGNGLAAPVSWSFTTGDGTDLTLPTVKSISPDRDARNIALDSPILITFEEPVYPFHFATIDGKLAKVEIDYGTDTVVTITPTNDLTADYYDNIFRVSNLARSRSITDSWRFWTVP